MNQTDYKAALESTRAMMINIQTQNERFIKTLKIYARSDWRDLVLFDQGKAARKILGEEIE